VSTPRQKIVFNQIRPEADRDPYGVAEAQAMLDAAYGWLDGVMANREWVAGTDFSLARSVEAFSRGAADHALPSLLYRLRDGLEGSSDAAHCPSVKPVTAPQAVQVTTWPLTTSQQFFP
jgi:glutathione S-transferase